jgi:transcriptional regulator with XRE-family HTH domain
MSIARRKMGYTQAELGRLLGVSQSVVSDLENGRVRIGDFTLGTFMSVFGDHATYVLYDAGADRYNPNHIWTEYWAEIHDSAQAKRVDLRRARNAAWLIKSRRKSDT